MKKNECNIVQDLIPLVIDRAASGESRELVETHIFTCEDCKKTYQSMKAALPEPVRAVYECEQQKYVDALRNVRKKRLKRRILSVCLVSLICMIAAFGGLYAHDRLFGQHIEAVDNSLYSLSLSRLKDGNIVVTADRFDISFDTTTCMKQVPVDNRDVCYLYYAAASMHGNSTSGEQSSPARKVMFVLGDNENQLIYEIRQGTPDHYITIWKEGEPIPDASEQLESWFDDSDD